MYYVFRSLKCGGNIVENMAPSHKQSEKKAKEQLYETIRSPYQKLDEWTGNSAGSEVATVITATAVGSLLATSPVFAQTGSPTQTLGQSLCSVGAGWIVTSLFLAGAIYLTVKGGSRVITAADHLGSAKEQKRAQGREEMVGAAKTAGGGLVGVPFVGALLGRIVPPAWGCIGFDLSFLIVTLPV